MHSAYNEMISNNNNNNKTTKTKNVVIVGGGPSGAAAAKAMSDRGYNVDLYEAYPNPKFLPKTSSKAYVIALSPRGQQGILDSTGIDLTKLTEEGAIVSADMCRHVYNSRTNETKVKVFPHKETKSLIVPRKVLVSCILDAATESGVRVHYHHRLVDADFEKKIATFVIMDPKSTEEKETTVVVHYDLLIGADGSNSKLRNLMVADRKKLEDFTARTEEDSMDYQVVVLSESPFDGTNFPETSVHSWNNKEYNAICLGFPLTKQQRNVNNENNKHDEDVKYNRHSMLFAIVFPEGKLASFRETDDGYRAPLSALLPDVAGNNEGLLSEIEQQLRENQIANGGLCVWSSCLGHDGGSVILLGDASSGMWPSLGQGANCALESVAVFTQCLDELSKRKNCSDQEDCWTRELVQKYNDARFEDATAAVDLTYGGIGARKSRGRLNAPLSYKLQIVGMMLLNKLTFGLVPMPALLRIMKGSKDLSYSAARNYHFYYEKVIVLGFLVGTATALSKMWSQFSRGSIGGEL